MSTFKEFLINRGYRKSTADGYSISVQLFFKWCEAKHIDPKKASLEDLYNYQSHLRAEGRAINTVRERLNTIKLYYKFINRSPNPALQVRSERRPRTLPDNLLEENELLNIYLSQLPKSDREMRNKCMLGLILFQGAKRDELESLEVDYLDLKNKRIYLPSTSKTNSRYLTLHPLQVDELEHYLDVVRPRCLSHYHVKTSKLFFSFSLTSAFGLQNPLAHIFKELRSEHRAIKSQTQLRSSRISIWVNSMDLRQAQYLSGFRYPSSLLRYKRVDIERLKGKLEITHPLDNFI